MEDLTDGKDEWLEDSRDLMVVLAPYHDCAQKLGLDVADVFRDAATRAPQELRLEVAEFGRRRDVTLADFGYVLVEAEGGLSYQVA